jgi:hypothetical protein
MGVDCKQVVGFHWEGCGAAGGHQAGRTCEQSVALNTLDDAEKMIFHVAG